MEATKMGKKPVEIRKEVGITEKQQKWWMKCKKN
jgi:hypothetical protein